MNPRRTYRDFVHGILLTVLLILLKGAVEESEFGRQLEQMTYNILQLRLLSRLDWNDSPITVVDISGLKPVPVEFDGRYELVTSRRALTEIVRAAARQKPRAIGIDLDFSPGPRGYVTPDDADFLQVCLDIQHLGIPVRIGIYDSVVLGPERWLGRPEFQSLAAYITIPLPEHTEPTTRMVEWVQPAGVSKPCPSLACALAQARQREIPSPLRWAVRRAALKTEEEFSASEFLVDYAGLERLMDQRVVAKDANAITAERTRIAGKIVLIGKATPGQAADEFNVPGRGTPVPGIYLHAAASYTLLQAPLYRLTHAGRVAADGLAALCVFGTILIVRLSYSRWAHRELATHRMHVLLTAVVILTVIVIGHYLVSTIRLIWTDYLMVVGALLLHSPAERYVGGPLGRLRSAVVSKWRARPVRRRMTKRNGGQT
jgi:CHASE2 domain-containing sensor protein